MAETTPEKKLLEIIEKAKEASGSLKDSVSQKTVKSAAGAKISARGALAGKLNFFPGIANIGKNFFAEAAVSFELKKINIILLAVTLVMAGYFVLYFSLQHINSSKKIKFPAEELSAGKIERLEGVTAVEEIAASSDNKLQPFIEKAKKRDLFKPAKGVQKQTGAASSGSQSAASELVKNLKLVGISVGQNPQDSYAMVEDANTKLTYFLKKDQSLFGFQIISVEKDRIIMTYGGEQVELR